MEDLSVEQNQKAHAAGSHKLLIVYTIFALALAIFVRFYIAAPYIVSGASMEPTFDSWHYLIIDRVSWRFEEPARGDVVVFDFPQDPSRSLIKRIIGLPGETVILAGNQVTIRNQEHPDGFVLDEPYISEEKMKSSHMSVTLGESEYFVLGDNRLESADSRYWGTLPKDLMVGRPLVRLFPLSEIELFPGEARYSE